MVLKKLYNNSRASLVRRMEQKFFPHIEQKCDSLSFFSGSEASW
jgi:hypothetical protein